MYEVPFLSLIATTTGLPLDRVAYSFAPENTPYPLVVLQTVVEVGQYTFSGRNKRREVIVQVDVWGDKFSSVAAIKDKLITLDGYVGDGVLKNIILDKIRQGADTAIPKPLHRYSLDFRIFYG